MRRPDDAADPKKVLAFFGVQLEWKAVSKAEYIADFKEKLQTGQQIAEGIGKRNYKASEELQQYIAYLQQTAGLSYQRWNRL